MYRRACGFVIAVTCLLAASANAQTTAKISEVSQVTASLLEIPGTSKILLIGARGYVSDNGWDNGRLIPYVYITPPADGIWDFDFVATRKPGPHIQILTPIFAFKSVSGPPSWVRGVRVHSSTNKKEVLFSKEFDLKLAEISRERRTSTDISFHLRYEDGGRRHCVVGSVEIELGPIHESYDIGHICIDKTQDSVSGTVGLGGGVDLKWELSVEDHGRRLCLSAKACKDFGFPVGEVCTPTVRQCVDIP